MGRVLILFPTHRNCQEVEDDLQSRGINAVSYPGRFTSGDELNCRNPTADAAENMGLPVVATICPVCEHSKECRQTGYLGKTIAASAAQVTLATHARASWSGFRELGEGREYQSIHENAVSVLRPIAKLCEVDLLTAQKIVDDLLLDPRSLNRLGANSRADEDGNRIPDHELKKERDEQYEFLLHLARMVDGVAAHMQTVALTSEWIPPKPVERPKGIERMLFQATNDAQVVFLGQPWKWLLAAASGELHSAAVIVDPERFTKDGGATPTVRKTLLAVWSNPPSRSAVVWFNDATVSPERLEWILGSPVEDKTPGGRLRIQHRALQVVRDIKRGTSPKTVQNILRGVLARPVWQKFNRVGVIGHSNHVQAIKKLGPNFENRISRVSHFGSGEERSSNEWHKNCDLLIVAGTPRVPKTEISSYLFQVGEVAAAARNPEWKIFSWHGVTESGKEISVPSSGYEDREWKKAHREIVRSAIVQAIGRGRGITESGIEVVVLSNEECGLPISDFSLNLVSESESDILQALIELTEQNPKISNLGFCSVSSAEIAKKLNCTDRYVRLQLAKLLSLGLVEKIGERGGWKISGKSLPGEKINSGAGGNLAKT